MVLPFAANTINCTAVVLKGCCAISNCMDCHSDQKWGNQREPQCVQCVRSSSSQPHTNTLLKQLLHGVLPAAIAIHLSSAAKLPVAACRGTWPPQPAATDAHRLAGYAEPQSASQTLGVLLLRATASKASLGSGWHFEVQLINCTCTCTCCCRCCLLQAKASL